MKKKVLIALPVLLVGGTEIQTLLVVRTLLSAGYRVTVCCYYEFEESVAEQFRCAGAEVVLLKLVRSSEGGGVVSRLVELVRRLGAVLREIRPDIVHVQYLAPGLIPILTARFNGIRAVFSTVHIAGNYAYGIKAKFFLRLASRLSTAFFCVSRSVETFWFGSSAVLNKASLQTRRRHFTIFNAVDVAGIERAVRLSNPGALRKSIGLRGRPVLGIVGRLAEQKGHVVLLTAMSEVIRLFPEVLLLVIGDGPERESLKEKALTLGLAGRVVWLGNRTQEEVFQLYGAIDIFVMPSLYEGFGLTAVEAMAAGLPVVASNVEGLCDVIEHEKTGFLFRAGDSRQLACRLLELLGSPDIARKMGQFGRERATTLFSLERFGESMRLAYRVLGEGQR